MFLKSYRACKKAKIGSQLRECKVVPTSTPEVVPISPESKDKDKDGPQDSELQKEGRVDL